jgi:cysteine desulfurase
LEEIYLDYNATTPVREEVLEIMNRVSRDCYANPSSLHFPGRRAKAVMDEARETIAGALGAGPSEIIFTSGGTESCNLAVAGITLGRPAGHLIASAIEHPAVLETCRFLEKRGYQLTLVPVGSSGLVDPAVVEAAVRQDTCLISIMWANNETGVVQPIGEIAAVARRHGIPFFTDAVQAFGKIPIDLGDGAIDMLSLSGHKIYAPKGVGALYIRRRIRPAALIHGGGQEKNLRSGTENVPGIAALAEASRLAVAEQADEMRRLAALRNALEERILSEIPQTWVNGGGVERIPNTSSLTFSSTESEAVLVGLDEFGIAASSASACSAAHTDPSHVLLAMGLNREQAAATLRFSFGRLSTTAHIDKVLDVLTSVVRRLRALSHR